MNQADIPELFDMLDATAELYDKPPLSAGVKAMWARDLAHLPIRTVRGAFDAHRRSPAGRFMPKPADVIAAIAEAQQTLDGHPGPDEAWSIAVQARSEDASVIWTDEIASAFFAAAMPLLDDGDKIAARKAFIDRYEVELAKARRECRVAKWVPSLGSNPDLRRQAVEAAMRAGRINDVQAANLLPAPEPSANAVLLLAGVKAAVKETDAEEARRKLAELRSKLRSGHERQRSV